MQDRLPGYIGESKNLASDNAIPSSVEGKLKFCMLVIMINIYVNNTVTCLWIACFTLPMDADLRQVQYFSHILKIFMLFVNKT